MGAMGNGTANNDQTISECSCAYYAERAKGGVGLIVNEVTRVNDAHGMMGDRQTSVTDDRFIPGLKKLANAVHFYGGAIFIQLHHPGRQTFVPGGECYTPSGVPSFLINAPCHVMTTDEVESLVKDFVDGAERCYKAGIDGVELHAAHGYMLNQFLSPFTNKRTDAYGGNTENRARILKEIIEGIRERVGRDYPVMLRISADEFLERSPFPIPEGEIGLKLDEAVRICKYLVPFGLDAINVSAGIYETMNEAWEPMSYEEGWKLYLAEEIKKAVDVPVFGVGVIRNPDFAEKVIAEGRVDGVTIARGLLADPDWVNKTATGRVHEIRRCISCLNCMETMGVNGEKGEPITCSVNARNGREWFYNDARITGNGRTVVVIGAGPAGMEASRELAERGFKVVLFEKEGQLGGQLRMAMKPPHKEKIHWLIEYFEGQFKRLGVEVRLNTPATVEAVRALDPYAVFVGTGSTPIVPRSIPGVEGKKVCTSADILTGRVKLSGKKVAVIGSGMTGLETAELLATQGNRVSIVEMADRIGPSAYWQTLTDVQKRLNAFDPAYYPGHKLVRVTETGVVLEKQDGTLVELEADSIVLSLGVAAGQSVAEEMAAHFDKVIRIGDTEKVGRIQSAITSGFSEAYRLD
jgi:2,4-dienoyl-CoA reductase-like NADH-dependent reductase (Old Yellow Enzyme family)/thioredoxin reductase